MPDAFVDATAALAAALAGACGLAVTYRRGEVSVETTAWRSCRTAEVDRGTGVLEEFEVWDWFLPTAALGALGPPSVLAGDRVEAPDGSTYEVAGLPGQRHFQYSGGAKTLLRIHTKLVGTETG
jgi:hypothetical protein